MTQLKVKREGNILTTMKSWQEYRCTRGESRTGADHLIYHTAQSHAIYKFTNNNLDTQILGLSFNGSVFLNQSLQLYVRQVLSM